MKQCINTRRGLRLCNMLLLACCVVNAYAQREQVWVFGKNAGLDFSSGIPAPFTSHIGTGVNVFGEANASVCDANGNLLFYSEGTRVLDRQHNLMPGGNNLVPNPYNALTGFTPTSSTSQGALIVPVPGSASRYYLFSLTSFEADTVNHFSKLYYSVIDMSLNNGFGDVVAGEKGILLDSVLTERMAAVSGDCRNIWLLAVAQNNMVKAYEITASGISAVPVTSPITTLPNVSAGNMPMIAGCIAAAPDRRKVAVSRYDLDFSGTGGGLALFDFDPASGTLTNERQLSPDTATNGVCFSPDNSKLYFSGISSGIYQIDLSAGATPAIIASKTQVTASGGSSHLKLAANGKIYFQGTVFSSGIFATTTLSVINAPDMAGGASMPQVNVATLSTNTGMVLGLPNAVPLIRSDTFSVRQQTTVCGLNTWLSALDPSGTGYVWNDGFAGPGRSVALSGTYWVRYQTACATHIDTFDLVLLSPAENRFTEVICTGAVFDFNGTGLGTPGLYRDTFVAANGCDSVVILDLVTLPPQDMQLLPGAATQLCIGDTIRIEASGAKYFQWYANGRALGTDPLQSLPLNRLFNEVIVVGTSENDCRDTIKTMIPADACCALFVPNAFSPNGDGINDGFGPETNGNFYHYQLFIYNRWGEKIFQSFRTEDKWDGTISGRPIETGTYFYQIKASCFEGSEVFRKGDISLVR